MISHNDLNDSQRDLLAEMYAECNETLDALPYTDKFETLYNDFLRRAGVSMDRHSFWRALSNARKASKLIRKER
jgi:hypothetical protein